MEREKIEMNAVLFFKKLEQLGVNNERLFDKYGEAIKVAPYALTDKVYGAFEGGLLQTILRILTPFAVKVNESLPDELKVEQNSLLKVCLLHQIAKATMFEPNDNEWEREKRNLPYKFAESNLALRTGMRSLIMCNECNITLTDVEIEALTIMDREKDDTQAKCFANPISVIIRQANELTDLQNRIIKE